MPRLGRSITIKSPPEQVFAYVSDISRHPEWASHRLRIESSASDGAVVGARFITVGHQLGLDDRNEVTVTDYEPPRRFGFEATSRDSRFRHVFELELETDGTRLTKSMDFVEMSLAARVLMPLIMFWAWWVLGQDLKRIGERLE